MILNLSPILPIINRTMTTHATYSQELNLFAILSTHDDKPYVLGLGDSFLHADHRPSSILDEMLAAVKANPEPSSLRALREMDHRPSSILDEMLAAVKANPRP